MKDNTSTPFFNGVKMSGWPQKCGQWYLNYLASLFQIQKSPRKGREIREQMRERERERWTYQSGLQGMPDPAGVLTCLNSMSRTQPNKIISPVLIFGLIYIYKNLLKSNLNEDVFFLSLSGTRTHALNIYPPQGYRNLCSSSAVPLYRVCVRERSQAVSS